jgi:hypothetical protein
MLAKVTSRGAHIVYHMNQRQKLRCKPNMNVDANYEGISKIKAGARPPNYPKVSKSPCRCVNHAVGTSSAIIPIPKCLCQLSSQ